MIIKRPLTEEQIKKIADRGKPSQDSINAASSELHEYELLALNQQDDLNVAVDFLLTDLMARVAALEDKD